MNAWNTKICIMKSVHWSVDLGVRIYLFQLHLFEMNQGVHIPFAWCVFRFIGVTYVLSSTSPSFSLKKSFKTLFHIVNFHQFCYRLYWERIPGEGKFDTTRKKETHSTHQSWIIFSPSGLSDNQTLRAFPRKWTIPPKWMAYCDKV